MGFGGHAFRAVVADSLDEEHAQFTSTLGQAEIPLVLAVKPSQVVRTPAPEPASPFEAAHRLRRPGAPGRAASGGVDGSDTPFPFRTRRDLVGD
jgi:hypothetical protein